VGRFVGARLINVCAVDVNRHRHHGRTGGEREGQGHEGDELLHGNLLSVHAPGAQNWSTLPASPFTVFATPMASNNVTMGAFAKIGREAVHTA
jgi:hypothetical protein